MLLFQRLLGVFEFFTPTFEELTTSSQLMLEISRALETSLSLPTSPYISLFLLYLPISPYLPMSPYISPYLPGAAARLVPPGSGSGSGGGGGGGGAPASKRQRRLS